MSTPLQKIAEALTELQFTGNAVPLVDLYINANPEEQRVIIKALEACKKFEQFDSEMASRVSVTLTKGKS